MRILLVANSQGGSAGLASGLNYPALLGERLGPAFDVRCLVVSGWSIQDVFSNLDDNVVFAKPDLVIFQLGIVEAAQRILSNRAKGLLSRLPFGRRITGWLHRHRALVLKCRKRLGLATRVVPPLEFNRLLGRLTGRLNASNIRYIFMRMPLFPDAGASLGHPYINDDITIYNQMLDQFGSFKLREPVQLSYFQTGTVHFSASGHVWLAEALASEIRQRYAQAA